MKVENINFLRKNYRYIRELLQKNDEILKSQPVEVISSKIGLPTIQVMINNRPALIHSKYDPVKEAEKLVEQNESTIEKYDHIFFYGVGMGYHVEKFMEKYEDKKFTLYEPNPAIFYHYMNQRLIEYLPTNQLHDLFVEWSQEAGSQFITSFAMNLKDNVRLIIHPAYSRIFPIELEQFTIEFKNKVQQKRHSFGADVAFAKRWTINSVMNLPNTLETPNLLVEKKHVFKDKPVLIVSAGPSLQDEYDQLRYIKENGLAYVLAVGSANKALIANDILPDAVCTYDPQEHNASVFKPLIENEITTVPMIYGTSVGYETLKRYKGPKVHFITSQDTITPYYTNNGDNQIEIVDDAFSIAIVTLQLMAKVGAGQIILVGQNFAFRDNQFYSEEIARGKELTADVQEKDLVSAMEVEDVYGNKVKTNASFNQMRLSMEQYIALYNDIKVINTTKGGAKIEGAPFTPLEEVIRTYLRAHVVEKEWYKADSKHSNELLLRIRRMDNSIKQFPARYENVLKVLKEIDSAIESKKSSKLQSLFVKFDKAFQDFESNDYYYVYIRPVSRLHYENLQKRVSDIVQLKDVIQKGKEIIQTFAFYANRCVQLFDELTPITQIGMHAPLKKKYFKFYNYQYELIDMEGNWKRRSFGVELTQIESRRTNILGSYAWTKEKGAKIKFIFKGTSLKLFGVKNAYTTSKLKITIDDKHYTISTKEDNKSQYFMFVESVLFEKENLSNTKHSVEIELLEDELFIFSGVKLDLSGSIIHQDEVFTIEDLEIGKRIRCHYKANKNEVGVFSGLGEENGDIIPPKSSAEPDGDFYFIMVDEEDGKKKLIADRNVQHSISWDQLYRYGVATEIGKLYKCSKNNYTFYVRLLTGGVTPEDKSNEWDKYVVGFFRYSTNLPGFWNSSREMVSWARCEIKGYPNRRARRSLVGERQRYANTPGSDILAIKSVNGFRPLACI